jgi:hypothetical protein
MSVPFPFGVAATGAGGPRVGGEGDRPPCAAQSPALSCGARAYVPAALLHTETIDTMNDEPLAVALLRVALGVCGAAALLVAGRILGALLPAAQIPGLTAARALAIAATFAMMGGALVLLRRAVTGRGRLLDAARGRLAPKPGCARPRARLALRAYVLRRPTDGGLRR